jgi:hypothetical protein
VAAQDDIREKEMRTLFNLTRPGEFGRGDIDAVLELEGVSVPPELRDLKVSFELKSTTKGRPDISTVRDLGPHHIEKWRSLHGLFGVYEELKGEVKLLYCLYGSPAQMKPWFDRVAAYAAPDLALIETVPGLIDDDVLTAVLGDSDEFDFSEAKSLMKMQYSRLQYQEAADRFGERYSREAMLSMLRERSAYLISRGATRNNPHISASYFKGWERIERNHAARLRELVIDAIQAERP